MPAQARPATGRHDRPVALRARGIERSHGRQQVLRGVDLDLHEGEVVALLGPNGAGKTTLMSVLVGLADPDAGKVDGPRAELGWVPQGGATWGRLTVRENLRLFAQLLRLPGDPAQVAQATAEEAGLVPWLDHDGWQLSGGLRQRLNVAVGLLGDPPVVVLDEPTTGVDLHHRHAMWSLLRQRANRGRAVLYSTHSLEDAGFADRVVVLAQGSVVYDGPLEDVARHAPPADGDDENPNRHGPDDTLSDPVARGLLALWGESIGPERA